MDHGLGPRDERSAALTAAALVLAGAAALVATQVVAEAAGVHGSLLVALVGAVLAGVGLAYLRWHARMPDWAWVLNAVVMLGVILGVNLATRDAGGGAQVAYLYPVVYAGAFLRTRAAWCVAVVAASLSSVSAFVILPVDRAITDQTFLVVAIAALTAVLLASGRRQDALVARLDAVASVDVLTGLATRRALEDAARRALAARAAEPRRASDSLGTALVLVDVDLFKSVNDQYGHPAGDAVLVHLAEQLRATVRAGDTVARFGGDELAILLPGIGPEDARRRAEGVRARIVAHPGPDVGAEQPVHVTVSVGVAHAPAGTVDLERLYVDADRALYQAKRAGRDQVVAAPAGGLPALPGAGDDVS